MATARLSLLVVLLLALPALSQTTRVHRPVVRYVRNQRVEVLRTDQWYAATVIGWDNGKVRIRTDDNQEFLVEPIQLRRWTSARSYPIKAAAEDVLAINGPATRPDENTGAPADQLRPGIPQPAEPDSPDENPKPSVDAAPVEQPEAHHAGELPLPPAPNALPSDLPTGDLSTATAIADPEKVQAQTPFSPVLLAAPAHALASSNIPLRSLDKRDAVFETPAPLLFAAPEFAQAFVPHLDRSPDAPTDLYYDRYDLTTGKRTGGFAVPADARVLDLSSDGTRLLLAWTSPDSQGVLDDCLGLFVVLNDRITLRTAWRPYATLRTQSTQGVDTAHILDATHILTSTGNDLTAWEIGDGARAQYRLYPLSPCKPAVTADGKFVAVASAGSAWILDASNGLPSLKLDGALPAFGGLFSFRPDARQLAYLTDNRLLVWTIPTVGQTTAHPSDTAVSLFNSAPASTLDWLADGYVLINHQYCADIAHQILLWDYKSEENGVGGWFAGQYWYSASSSENRVLAHLSLPDAPALHQASQINPATLMAVYPGAKISIDLSNLDADDLLKSRAVVALTAKLHANEIEVANNQPVRLVVTSTPGQTREITYRGSTAESTTTVNLPEDLITVAFVENDKTAWQTTRPATPPGVLALRPGQSADEFLASERGCLRLVTATSMILPRFVPHPHGAPVYGQSLLTQAGSAPSSSRPHP